MIKIKDLIVTQNGLRLPQRVNLINKEILTTYTIPGSKIKLFCEGADYYIADGHTRLSALYLLGVEYIIPSEYELLPYSAKHYDEFNWSLGYCTPFDIFKEVRLSNFQSLKKRATEIYNEVGQQAAEHFVLTNAQAYKASRELYTLEELVEQVMELI